MQTELKNTNYVVVVDYEDGQTLEDCFLLGWDNKYDWFDSDTCGWEIVDDNDSIKKNDWGLIKIDDYVAVYVGEEISSCKSYK